MKYYEMKSQITKKTSIRKKLQKQCKNGIKNANQHY